jgi:phage-related minor tail protein
MSIADKMWDAITTVIRMNDKVERLAGTIKTQQEKIENLTERVIRLETALEIALARPQPPKASTRRLPHKA